MPFQKILSIIIVTYNSQHEIGRLLSTLKTLNAEVIIVDNASDDETNKKIRLSNLEVKLISNKTNVGFAKAANQGAKKASGKYLLFVNPDIIFKKTDAKKIVDFIESKKDAAVVGCKILNPDGTLQPSCGSFPTMTNVIIDRIPILNTLLTTQLIRRRSYYNKEHSTDWITGAFLMTKKKLFNTIGQFDENYFLYVEDIDLCYRAKKAGYSNYFCPSPSVIHLDLGKSYPRKNFKAKQIREGLSIFFEKYKPPYYAFIWKSILKMESIFRPALGLL
jgi:GT2 family glycosyltransferase